MQNGEDSSDERSERGTLSVHDEAKEIYGVRPHRPQGAQVLNQHDIIGQVLAENKKRAAEAGAHAPEVSDNGKVLLYPDDAHEYEKRRRDEEASAKADTLAHDAHVKSVAAAAKAEEGAIIGAQIGFKIAMGQFHSEQQAGFRAAHSAEQSGLGQAHAAAQAAARAKDAIDRSAARPSTPSAGRSL